MKATVSIGKLISYAKSKGSKAEFAGQTYSTNIKLAQLKSQSALKAYETMFMQLKSLSKDMFDFSLKIVEDPFIVHCSGKSYYAVKCDVIVSSNGISTNYYNLIYNTLKELALTSDEVSFNKKSQIGCFESRFFGYMLPFWGASRDGVDKEIISNIEDALFRYKINAIGSPKNSYSFEWLETSKEIVNIIDHSGKHISQNYFGDAFSSQTFYRSEKGIMLYSSLLQQYIPFGYVKLPWGKRSDIGRRDLIFEDPQNTTGAKFRSWFSNFAMEETKKPLKLSKEQKKEVKNGTYTGSRYSITYSNPKEITRHKLILYIPKESIGDFQGFEIQF